MLFRILKYPVGYEKGKPYAWCPEGKCIRIDYTENIDYKGYFAWIIVDSEQEPKFEKRFLKAESLNDVKDGYVIQLGVLEEQTIETEMDTEPGFVFIDKGKIYLTLEKDCIFGGDKKYKICGYKTGQDIPIHPQNLEYLGFVPLVIKQEIAIYFFRVFR